MERLGKRPRQLSLSAKARYQRRRRAETESKVGLASSWSNGHWSTDDHRKAVIHHHRSGPTLQFECRHRLYLLVHKGGRWIALRDNSRRLARRWKTEVRALLWRPESKHALCRRRHGRAYLEDEARRSPASSHHRLAGPLSQPSLRSCFLDRRSRRTRSKV